MPTTKSIKIKKTNKNYNRLKKGGHVKTKQVQAIAKKVVINNQEMRRRETGVLNIQYLDGVDPESMPATTVFKGLNTRSPCNFILNPLNYGWQNDQTSTTIDHFNGKSIHPRFLKSKLLFSFPGGAKAIQDGMRIQLVWGFIKRPFMLTPYTNPVNTEVTKAQLREMALHQVEREYDQPLDQLKFAVKRPNNYVVVGKRWIRPDRRFRIGAPQNLVEGSDGLPDPRSTGQPPMVKETIEWKMGKEWRLTKSGDSQDESTDFWYNNEQYIPWFLVYNPDYGNVRQDPANYQGATDPDPGAIKPGLENGGGTSGQPVPEENRIQVEHNSCIWFNDA